MPQPAVTHATLGIFAGDNQPADSPITVQFNPASLQYTINNTLEQNRSKKKAQYVSQSTAKLTMDLMFDTTHNGEDVRKQTGQIEQFMKPKPEKGSSKSVPLIVQFEWGLYKFKGIIESYKETIDFFAPTGVPLRAAVNVTLSSQDAVFDPTDTSGKFNPPVTLPPGGSASAAAKQGGDPGAGRGVAAANNQDSLRFPSGPITVGAGISLSGPVAFASIGVSAGLSGIGLSGGAGIGIGVSGGLGLSASGGAGIGIGVSGGLGLSASGGAGIGIGVSGGIGISGGAGIGIGGGIGVSGGIGLSGGAGVGISGGIAIGGSLSAGVPATAGAFAGLSVNGSSGYSVTKLDTSRFLRTTETVAYVTGDNASFTVGGQIRANGETSLRADVGVNASLRTRIQFEETF